MTEATHCVGCGLPLAGAAARCPRCGMPVLEDAGPWMDEAPWPSDEPRDDEPPLSASQQMARLPLRMVEPSKRARGVVRLPARRLVVLVVLLVALSGTALALAHVRSSAANGHAGGTGVTRQSLPLYSWRLRGDTQDWPSNRQCNAETDGYHITAATACFPVVASVASVASVADAALAVSAKQLGRLGGGFYGIAFRQGGQGSYYLFAVNTSGQWEFAAYVKGAPNPLVQPTADGAILPGIGVSNRLEVAARGPRFDFFINGAQVGSATDASSSAGIFGLAGTANADVVFTDLNVATLT
ncbi:MAG TPA: hypothetical protein VKC57_04040 [Ktedonobacterales bacterium]|nr:hypothetical protein [Ktedonobacterales bacterium]